jgi:hypothetical protein
MSPWVLFPALQKKIERKRKEKKRKKTERRKKRRKKKKKSLYNDKRVIISRGYSNYI